MDKVRIGTRLGLLAALVVLGGCGFFSRGDRRPVETPPASEILDEQIYGEKGPPKSTLLDFFRPRTDEGEIGAVNKYIWNASLEVLNFLPIQSIDPFTGVITTGYGVPPGGGQAYRATVYISDPALDARSLNIAMQGRGGPVSADTVRAVEDAILTRARQLRQNDSRY